MTHDSWNRVDNPGETSSPEHRPCAMNHGGGGGNASRIMLAHKRALRRRPLLTGFLLFLPSVIFLLVANDVFNLEQDISMYTCDFSSSRRNGEVSEGGCQEEVYHFDCISDVAFIFTDQTLIQRCQARPYLRDGHRQLAHMEAQLPPDKSHNASFIRTKCRFTLPKLLSYYRHTRPERDSHKVPNLVHYVWFSNKREFSFVNYLSFFSASKFLGPSRILIHGDTLPSGFWWNKMIQEVPNVYFVNRERPTLIQGEKPGWIEHEADIVRLQTLYANGGIYLDTDVLILRSFDPLRNYELSLGQESEGHYSNGILVAQPHSPFICVWLNSYRQYPRGFRGWNTFSVRYPYLLSLILKDHVHVEVERFTRPNAKEATSKLYEGYFDWSNNYAVHIWHRMKMSDKKMIPKGPDDVIHNQSSLSDIINYIFKAQT